MKSDIGKEVQAHDFQFPVIATSWRQFCPYSMLLAIVFTSVDFPDFDPPSSRMFTSFCFEPDDCLVDPLANDDEDSQLF